MRSVGSGKCFVFFVAAFTDDDTQLKFIQSHAYRQNIECAFKKINQLCLKLHSRPLHQ